MPGTENVGHAGRPPCWPFVAAKFQPVHLRILSGAGTFGGSNLTFILAAILLLAAG